MNNALIAAQNYAEETVAQLTSNTNPVRNTAGRYSSWFGNNTAEQYDTATNYFNSIATAISSETIEFVCDCNLDSYAFVYPNEPYQIHICKQFWNASITGTNSQSGVIIHEISHFDDIAGTDDLVYGQVGAYNLAQNNPVDALNNADNYEFFAENTPYLPMFFLVLLSDNFNDSCVIDALKFSTLSENYTAGIEADEPNHAGITGGKSLWFSWQAPATGTVRASTAGSSFDTLLAVYTGNTLSNLTEIGSNDDILDSRQSEVSFQAIAGTIYHIAIDGYGGAVGLAYLSFLSDFGDIDNDGLLNLSDAIKALQLLSGNDNFAELNVDADIDGNKAIGLEEVLFILTRIENEK